MREVICYTKSEKLGILRKVLKFGNFGQIFFEFRIQKGHFLFVPRCYYQDFSDLLNEFLYFESSVIFDKQVFLHTNSLEEVSSQANN